jgi:hypothetical protein
MTSTTQNGHTGLSSLSAATKTNAAAMVAAIVGIVIQIAAGVDYPTIPPGPIILGVAVALVLFTRWPWVAYVGVIVPLFLLVGGIIAAVANEDNGLRDPGDIAAFGGSVLQVVAVVIALVAGVQALRERRA